MNNLPPPLDPKEQEELLRKLPDKEARENLIYRNLRMAPCIANGFISTGIEREELEAIAVIGLIKAIDTYNFDKKVSLFKYASRCMKNEILMYLRKQRKKNFLEVSLEELVYVDVDGNELFLGDLSGVLEDPKSSLYTKFIVDIDNFFYIINIISNILYRDSVKEFVIFLCMIGEETQCNIANLIGISQTNVSKMFKKMRGYVSYYDKFGGKVNPKDDIYFFYRDGYLCLKLKGKVIERPLMNKSFSEIAKLIWNNEI